MYLLCTTYTRNTSLFVLSKFSNRVGKYSMREKLGSFKCSEKISRVQTFIGFFLFLYNKRKLDLVFFSFFLTECRVFLSSCLLAFLFLLFSCTLLLHSLLLLFLLNSQTLLYRVFYKGKVYDFGYKKRMGH